MVVIMFYNNFDNFMKCINYIFFVVLLHNLLALLIGFSTGTFFKVPRKDRRTLTVETGIQNSGLGLVLLLNTNIFPAEIWHGQYGGMLVIAAWWGIWHIISGLTVSYLFNRSKLPQDQQ
jgi:BASS family bile acid:Na+ symporter